MPVNPYDDRKVSLWMPNGNGDLDIIRASYTRRTTNTKPHSHCAGVATVHPDAGQPVYRDAPTVNCVLTLPTLPRYRPGPRESKTPVGSRFNTVYLRRSTVEPRFMPVYPGVTQVVYGDVPVTTCCPTVTCRYSASS